MRGCVLACLLAGTAFGVLVSLCNAATWSPLQLISVAIGSGVGWAVFAVVVGWVIGSVSGRRRLRPAIGATVALLAAVLAYYACDEVVSAVRSVDLRGIPAPREEQPPPGYVPEVLTWALAALVTGPLLGLAGAAVPPWAKVRARPAE